MSSVLWNDEDVRKAQEWGFELGKVYTVPEVRQILRKDSNQSIRSLAKTGQLPGKKVGRDWRFSGHNVLRFIRHLDGSDA